MTETEMREFITSQLIPGGEAVTTLALMAGLSKKQEEGEASFRDVSFADAHLLLRILSDLKGAGFVQPEGASWSMPNVSAMLNLQLGQK